MSVRLRSVAVEIGVFAVAIIAIVLAAALALALASVPIYFFSGRLPEELIGPFGVITGASFEAPSLFKKRVAGLREALGRSACRRFDQG